MLTYPGYLKSTRAPWKCKRASLFYWPLVRRLRAAFISLVQINARISAVIHYLPKYKTWNCYDVCPTFSFACLSSLEYSSQTNKQ